MHADSMASQVNTRNLLTKCKVTIPSLGYPCPLLCVRTLIVYSSQGFQHALKHKLS